MPGRLVGADVCRVLSRQSLQAGARRRTDRYQRRQIRAFEARARYPDGDIPELVELGGGRILGQHALQFWSPHVPDRETIHALLQSSGELASARFQRLEARFHDWYAWTLDLPGTYYLQAVEHLFKENRLATARFVALGRRIDLSKLACPLFLLAARDDDIVAPEQVFATERLVDGQRGAVRKSVAPCGHLGLFMGKEILANVWPEIARWLGADEAQIGGSEQAGASAAAAGFSATPRSR
jgi:pimeloyl-ACP methyl ester carboxylesterase